MTTEKVRIVNKKGEHRFVMPHIANDKKLMKNSGYRIEDLNFKEDTRVIKPVAVESLPEKNDDFGFQDLTNIQNPTEQPKGKPGRNQTLKNKWSLKTF